jgi:hypothetical protein
MNSDFEFYSDEHILANYGEDIKALTTCMTDGDFPELLI